MLFLFSFLLFNGPKPMNVMPGDPILNISVSTLDGQAVKLQDAMDTGFCFVLSLNCDYCHDALEQIKLRFSQDHHTVLLFVDQPEKVRTFQKRLPQGHGMDIYTVDTQVLKPYAINTLPAMLLYHQRQLAIAFHGPLNQKNAKHILKLYQQKYLGE